MLKQHLTYLFLYSYAQLIILDISLRLFLSLYAFLETIRYLISIYSAVILLYIHESQVCARLSKRIMLLFGFCAFGDVYQMHM